MVNWDMISLFIFFLLLMLIYFRFKEKFTTQGIFVMYKTQLGIKLMDKLAKPYPRVLKYLSNVGVFLCFLGMGFIVYFLVKETWKLIYIAGTQPALVPVLPGIEIAGAPALSFWHWIIAIFIAAAIHEFSHGLIARLHNIPVKSSGFAFLGPLLAAFVEPDEKVLEKKKPMQQLGVFAAGPFSNILLGGFILILLLFVIAPIIGTIYEGDGIIVNQMMDDYPMNSSGVSVPFTILALNGQESLDTEQFSTLLSIVSPGDTVTLTTDQGDYVVTLANNPTNESAPFFGIAGLEQKVVVKEEYSYLSPFTPIIDWFKLLTLWVFLISVGVGLFNLLPLGPVDGGRMFYTGILAVTKNEKFSKNALIVTTIFCLSLILINMLPWLNKLFLWLGGIFSLLIALL